MSRFSLPQIASRPMMLAMVSLFACDGGEDKPAIDTGEFADSGDSAETGETGDSGPVDADGDGFVAEIDCDDTRWDINPDALETCDELDNNCNTEIDEGVTLALFADTDGDGFGDSDTPIAACAIGPGIVDNSTDCDDSNSANHPDAVELCDGRDNDCDGENDEDLRVVFYVDADGDEFGDLNGPLSACEAPDGYAANYTDCDDSAADINPGALEVCDALDNNCDGQIDENVTIAYYADADGDGFGDNGAFVMACEAPADFTIDNTDCDDTDYSTYPLAPEMCDERDNSCDGIVDEGVTTSYFFDVDGDGFGDALSVVQACTLPSGTVENDTDCDDAEAATYPGAAEVCDGRQTDCAATWANDAGLALWTAADGSLDDMSSTLESGSLAAPTAVGFNDPGTLSVCDGLWYVHISVVGVEVSIIGIGDAVLSGGGLGSVVAADASDISLSNLTLTDGLANAELSSGRGTGGGAAVCKDGTITLDNVYVESSFAEYGGGVATDDCDITVLNSIFEQNEGTEGGGGIFHTGGVMVVSDSQFVDNVGVDGGAVEILGGSIHISSSVFEGNTATESGGALAAKDCNADFTDLSFTLNEAAERGGGVALSRCDGTLDGLAFSENVAGQGGALAMERGTIDISASTFILNSASRTGGAVLGSYWTGAVTDVSIESNGAGRNGGGIALGNSILELSSVTFDGNTSSAAGGGLFASDSTVNMVDASFSTNDATSSGGGVHQASGTTLSATSCDFTANTPEDVSSELSGTHPGLGLDVGFSCDPTNGCVF